MKLTTRLQGWKEILHIAWPLMIFPTWLVSSHVSGIYWSWAAASFFIIFQSFIFWLRFKGGKWKNMSVIN